MAQGFVQMPFLRQPPHSNGHFVSKGPYTEGATQSFLKNSIVILSSGLVVVMGNNPTTVFGLAPQSAVGTGVLTPPDRLFRDKHYPFDLRDCIVELTLGNTTQDSTGLVAGPAASTCVPGTQVGLVIQTSGTYNKYIVAATAGSNKVAECISWGQGVIAADVNPRIWVRFLDSALVA